MGNNAAAAAALVRSAPQVLLLSADVLAARGTRLAEQLQLRQQDDPASLARVLRAAPRLLTRSSEYIDGA